MRNGDHWPFEVEFLLAGEVEHTPIGANGAFVADLPRLVEGFDDEVVVALAVKLVDQRAQVDRLVGLGGIGPPAHAAVARPADLGQQQRLFREQVLEVAGAIEHELAGVLHGDEFPIGQDVGGDQVDVLGELRIFLPDVPLLGRGHRHFDRSAHAVQVAHELLWRHLFAEQGLVTHRHPHDTAAGVGQFDGAGHLALVAVLVGAQPHAQGHAQTELFGQARNVAQGAIHRVDTDAVRHLAHQLHVLTHLVVRRVLSLLRALPGTEG
ncbi:hypothetical protein D3C76_784000 [compost metagenome]